MRAPRARRQTRPAANFLAVLLAAALAACGAPDPELTTDRLTVQLPRDLDCRPPDPVSVFQVQALGDFPASDERFERFGPLPGETRIDRFPLDTQMLKVTALTGGVDPWRAVGLHRVGDADLDRPLLLLPLGRSCLLGDPLLAALPGSVAVPLPGGGFLLAGGREGENRAVRHMVALGPGENIADSSTVELDQRRLQATATRTGSLVIIAGGANDQRSIAHDTYEMVDSERGELVVTSGQLCPEGAPSTCTGRRQHGAGLLPDGRVLLVGGYDQIPAEASDLLDTATIIDPRTGVVEHLAAEPVPWPGRKSPQVLTLDDGNVFVVGGTSETGAVPEPSVGSVHWFIPETGELFDLRLPFRSRPHAVAVALPGARIAWVGGDATVELLVTHEGLSPPLRSHVLDFTGRLPPLADVRAVALADGRILITGADAGGSVAAYAIDLSLPSVERLDGSLVPTHLLLLADGAVAEIGAAGASLRREAVRTPFDSPPATLGPPDVEWLALDAPDKWEASPAGLAACVRDGEPIPGCLATIHLPTLLFADVDIALDVQGRGDLILTAEAGPEAVRVVHLPGAVEIPLLCSLEREEGEEVRIERRGARLVLRGAAASEPCTITGLEGRIRLSLELDPGATFRTIRIARR